MKTKILINLKFIFILLLTLSANFLYSQIYTPVLKTYLDEQVNETSGLIFYNGKLWTHNDSGGEPKLYQIDTLTGSIIRTKVIKNAINRDWEDICIDDQYAYIGDIGNNSGKLDKFTIYKIQLEDLDSELNDSINSESIIFSYNPEYYRRIENKKSNNSNFDCEAMIAKGDSLYLFSKNWVDKKCYFYSIPKIPGQYMANLRDTLDVKGLVCGADYNEKTNTLALIGYIYGIPAPSLLVLISGFEEDNFFDGNITRKELELKGYQTEGVTFVNNSTLWISNEFFLGNKQALYEISLRNMDETDRLYSFNINPDTERDTISFYVPVPGKYKFRIFDAFGNPTRIKSRKIKSKDLQHLDISDLPSGNFILKIFNSKISFTAKFEKQ